MGIRTTEKRKPSQAAIPNVGIYPELRVPQAAVMLSQGEIVALLEAKIALKEISQADVAEVLGVQPSRMTELFKHRKYQLRLDQAVKLVEAFQLESPRGRQVPPVPAETLRLVVLYVAEELGVSLLDNEALLEDLIADVRAFAEYVADSSRRDRLDLAEEFFRVMKVRRPTRQAADRRENGPEKTR